ncbi:hypothetical protein [Microcystis phage MaeS]|nr:hypothetical protein [Microcystis phage MaeS]
MIVDKLMEIIITRYNRSVYQKVANKPLEYNEILFINQKDLPVTSRLSVECVCVIFVGKVFLKKE